MAQVKRKALEQDAAVPLGAPADHRYRAGGPVAALQADLERRLGRAGGVDAALPSSPADPLVRFVSTAGGYLLLAAGYAATAALIVRWF